MKLTGQSIRFSASDLVNYLGCRHLTELDRNVALGKIHPPEWYNPTLELLRKKGIEHEQNYVDHLKSQGLEVMVLDGNYTEATIDAMKAGPDIITQARFEMDGWVGIADILRKVPGRSDLGDWHYVVEDTKLARETKAGTILQLCLYSELAGTVQGYIPEHMYVVKPGTDFPTEKYRFAEFVSYYRTVKSKFQEIMNAEPAQTYPLPVGKCNTCRWWKECNRKWHEDDHLSLIAGIRSGHIQELEEQGIFSLENYARESRPFRKRPEQGNLETYQKIHHQAQVQFRGREQKEMLYDLLPVEELRGLNRLPEPSLGDLYFDIEGDHFYEEGGLEYLFGISYRDEGGDMVYRPFWAKDRIEERKMFSDFMEFVLDRWNQYPDMHIYHYAPYEPSAIKRLASRSALYEREVDSLLRSDRFLDLFSVIKETLVASVESYSLKDIERFTDFARKADLQLASSARRRLSIALDFNDVNSLPASEFDLIEAYNKDDCLATKALHEWIEAVCQKQVSQGADLF